MNMHIDYAQKKTMSVCHACLFQTMNECMYNRHNMNKCV